jgi:ComF family protein
MDAALLRPRSRLARWLWRLAPGFCIRCRQHGDLAIDLCEVCLRDLPWTVRACTRCALPLDDAPAEVCAACAARPPPWTRTIAPLRYRGAAIDLVRSLKFDGDPVSGRVLATLMKAAIDAAYDADARPQVVIPVPLSLRRLLLRGQNQAAVLARRVARPLRLPVDYDACRRVRHTAPQTGRSRRERRANLRGAFECTRRIEGQTVALVDDVVTTGATVRAVTRALLDAGAASVHVWAAARTDRPGFR